MKFHIEFTFRALPVTKKHKCSVTLYMAWLEMLTNDMPPLL